MSQSLFIVILGSFFAIVRGSIYYLYDQKNLCFMKTLLLSVLFASFSLFLSAQTGGVEILDHEYGLNGITFGKRISQYGDDFIPIAGEPGKYAVLNTSYLHMEGVPVSDMIVETYRNKIHLISYRVSPENAPKMLDFFLRKYGYPQFFFQKDELQGTAFEPGTEISNEYGYSWWGPKAGLIYWPSKEGDDGAFVQLFDENQYRRKQRH